MKRFNNRKDEEECDGRPRDDVKTQVQAEISKWRSKSEGLAGIQPRARYKQALSCSFDLLGGS